MSCWNVLGPYANIKTLLFLMRDHILQSILRDEGLEFDCLQSSSCEDRFPASAIGEVLPLRGPSGPHSKWKMPFGSAFLAMSQFHSHPSYKNQISAFVFV